jgi:hypothetical protein
MIWEYTTHKIRQIEPVLDRLCELGYTDATALHTQPSWIALMRDIGGAYTIDPVQGFDTICSNKFYPELARGLDYKAVMILPTQLAFDFRQATESYIAGGLNPDKPMQPWFYDYVRDEAAHRRKAVFKDYQLFMQLMGDVEHVVVLDEMSAHQRMDLMQNPWRLLPITV